MPAALEMLLEPLRHSPRLVEAVELLQKQIQSERELRQKFYEEMTEEQKIEFIDGEVVLHSPARAAHLVVTKYVLQLLDLYVRRHKLGEIMSEKCLCIFPRNDYEPDVVFFGPEKAAQIQPVTMKFPAPDLVVEVLSESTEHKDRGVKFEDYEAHGVEEYWIIDAEAELVEQYLRRGEGFYLALKSGTGEIRSAVITGFCVPVRAFFDEAENLKVLRGLLE